MTRIQYHHFSKNNLKFGTVDQVKIKAREQVDIFSGSCRFIENTGCAIPSTKQEEKSKTMIEAARYYF